MNKSIALVTAIALTAAVGAQAGPGHHGNHQSKDDRIHQRIERMAERLDLSGEQLAQMRSIADQAADEELRQAIKTNRRALQEASEFENYDPEQIADLAAQGAELKAQATVQRMATRQEILAVLTAEQRAELASLREQRSERRAQRRANRQARRAGGTG